MVHNKKIFFLKLFIISAPFVFLLLYSEVKLRDLPTSYSIKKENLEKDIRSYEVLVLGSSEAYDDIDPEYFSIKGFNLANSSQTLLYDRLLFAKYADQMRSLKIVVISVSYFSLWYRMRSSVEHWREYFYKDIYGITGYSSCNLDARNFSYVSLYGMNTTRDYFQNGFSYKFDARLQPNGWLKRDTVDYLNLSDAGGKFWVNYVSTFVTEQNFKENFNNIEMLISEVKARGVYPVLVTPPIHYSYYSNLDTAIEEKNEEAIREIRNKYGCKYFDYERDTRFVNDDFADIDHLNSEGAKKFSKILDREIISTYTNSANIKNK